VADAPTTEVVFPGGAPDPGRRIAHGLPRPLPEIGDDFDWLTRDYDGFRLFMMEELAALGDARRPRDRTGRSARCGARSTV
jgi:hypothetical protein